MTRVIYKFEITNRPIGMTKGAKIIHAGYDRNKNMCIWAEVDPDASLVNRIITVFGTGTGISHNYTHVGSFIDGDFVWHVYDGGEGPL